MKKTSTEIQIAPDFLQIGSVIQLKAGHNRKRNRVDFIPQFVEDDNILSSKSWHGGSIRIFIPDKPVNLETGEVWNVKVAAYNIGDNLTKDARAYVYVNVEVVSRDEYFERDPDFIETKFFIRKKSGDRILDEKSVPIEVIPKRFYREKDMAVNVKLYRAGYKVFSLGFCEYYSREEFVQSLAKATGRQGNVTILAKAFDKLPKLPEVVDIKSVNF
jgi:hypothetical protein